MKKLNVAVIGLGVGARHAEIYNLDKRTNLVTLCDFNKKKIQLLKKKYSNCHFTTQADEIFKDPNIDIVSIASYDNFHYEHILKSIKYKKNFFVEKPFCLSFFELKKIILKLKKSQKIYFSSNLILRNSPWFKDIKKKIKKSFFGKLYYCEGDYNYGRINKILNGWRNSIPFYSVMLGGGIHLLDLIISLVNKKVSKVIAAGNNISTKGSNFKHLDFASSLLKFDNDIVCKVSANFGSVTPHNHIFKVYGKKASVHYSDQKSTYYKLGKTNNPKKANYNYKNSEKAKILKSFISTVYNKKESSIVSRSEVLNLMSVSLSIEKSLKTGRWEKVNYINYKK